MENTEITSENYIENNPLGYAPIPGLLCKFAIPAIISMLVNAIYNITDQIFIAHMVGMLGNGATNVVFPITVFALAMAQLAGIGTSANYNMSLGAKEYDEANKYVGNGIALMFLMGICLLIVSIIFKTTLLNLCGATDKVISYANDYFSIIMFGQPLFIVFSSLAMVIRSDRSPNYAMCINLFGVAVNIFLDWLFMVVLGYGIKGAATATLIGQATSFIIAVSYIPRFKGVKITLKDIRLDFAHVVGIAKLGVANFINHFVMTIMNIVMNNSLAYYGALSIYGSEIPLAVSGVVAKVNNILSGISVGLSHGTQPILSYNMGAKNYSRVKETLKTALKAAMVVSLLAFALFQLFPRQIISIFGTGNELYYSFAEEYLRIFLMMVCVFGVQPLAINYFTSIGYVKQGLLITLSRQGLILIPLILILPRFFGLDGILYAGPIADGAVFVLSATLLARSFKKFDEIEEK